MDEHVEAPDQHDKPARKKKWLATAIVVLLIVVAAVGVLIYTHRSSSPLSAYARQISFPLYYPSKLPDSYYLNAKTISLSSDLVFYELNSTSQKPALVITQQSMPDGFDAKKLVGEKASALAVPVGTLYDISAGKQSKYMLTTGTTLVFISTLKKVDASAVNALASSLQQVK